MIDREYLKLNTSIQTGSNADHLIRDDEGNITATIELRLPDSLFNARDGNKQVDKVTMQTSKFRLSLENTPIAEVTLDNDRTTDTVKATICQLDVYPFCLLDDGEFKPSYIENTAFPNYKNHIVWVYLYRMCRSVTSDPGYERVFRIRYVANSLQSFDVLGETILSSNDEILPILNTLGITNKLWDHMMNLCAQSNHEPYNIEGNKLLLQNIGTLEQMLQDALENAVTFAMTSSENEYNTYILPKSEYENHTDLYPESFDKTRTYTVKINNEEQEVYIFKTEQKTLSVDSQLATAFKPRVSLNEQSLTISYDTAAFKETIPIFWNTEYIDTYDCPEQMTIDTLRNSVWSEPPPKRVYKYGVNLTNNQAELSDYAIGLYKSLQCKVMNLIVNKDLADTFSFLPWIRTTIPIDKWSSGIEKKTEVVDRAETSLIHDTYTIHPRNETVGVEIRTILPSAGNTDIIYKFAIDRKYINENISHNSGETISFNNFVAKFPLQYRMQQQLQMKVDDSTYQHVTITIPEREHQLEVNYPQPFNIKYSDVSVLSTNIVKVEEPVEPSTTVLNTYSSESSTTSNTDKSYYVYLFNHPSTGDIEVSSTKYNYAYPSLGDWIRDETSISYFFGVYACPPYDVNALVYDTQESTEQYAYYIAHYTPTTNFMTKMCILEWRNPTLENMIYTNSNIETARRQVEIVSQVDNNINYYYPNLDIDENSKSVYILDGTTSQISLEGPDPIKKDIYTETISDYTSTTTIPGQSYALCIGSYGDGSQFFSDNIRVPEVKIKSGTFYTLEDYPGEEFIRVYERKDSNGNIIDKYIDAEFEPTTGAPMYNMRFQVSGETDIVWQDGTTVTTKTATSTLTNYDITPFIGKKLDNVVTIHPQSFVDNTYTYEPLNRVSIPDISNLTQIPDDHHTYDTFSYFRNIGPGPLRGGLPAYRNGEKITGLSTVPCIIPPISPNVTIQHSATETYYYYRVTVPSGDVFIQSLTSYAFVNSSQSNMYHLVQYNYNYNYTKGSVETYKEIENYSLNTQYDGNIRVSYTWNNLPIVCLSPISSIVLTLSGMNITQEIQPVNITDQIGSSLTSTVPVVENFYSLASTLRDLHDELVVTKESFDDTATYTLSPISGQERTITLSAKYITKDGILHQILIPPNGVFSVQLTFCISYFST